MKTNKIGIISEILLAIAILLFVVVGFCFDESNAIALIVFYILIMLCVFTAIMIQIERIIQSKQTKKNEDRRDD